MRNLRPLATAAGTGNGIGTLVGAGGSGGISQDSRERELLRPHPGRQRQLPDRGVAGQLAPPVVRDPGRRPVPGPAARSGKAR